MHKTIQGEGEGGDNGRKLLKNMKEEGEPETDCEGEAIKTGETRREESVSSQKKGSP